MSTEGNKMDKDPLHIYKAYLEEQEKTNRFNRREKSLGMYTASGAGLCMKKQWYLKNDAKMKTQSNPTRRKLQLGTIIGNYFEKAIKWYASQGKKDYLYYTERQMKHKEYNISGSFDLLILDKDNKGYLYDWKTTNVWSWKSIFSDKSTAKDNYEYQLGTYAMMLEDNCLEVKGPPIEIVEMGLVYYKKDDSVMKIKPVELSYKTFARDYWERVNNIVTEPTPSMNNYMPAYKWECGDYCDYVDICDSPYIKRG